MKGFLVYGENEGSLFNMRRLKRRKQFSVKIPTYPDSSFNNSTVFPLNVTSAALFPFHCTKRLIVKITLKNRK